MIPPPSEYPLIFTLSPYPHAAVDLVLFVHSFFPFHCLSRSLHPLLLAISFIFSLSLCFPFSLHLEFIGLGHGWDAMLGFAIWYWWFLISVVLIDFGGFLISMAGFVGWSGWLWVLGVGWSGWFWVFVMILWFYDLDDSLMWWLWYWWVDVVLVIWVGGYGGRRR